MQYKVRVTEVRVTLVPVEAESLSAAKLIAERNWRNNEYADSRSHTKTTKFETLYPERDPCDISYIPRLYWKTYHVGSRVASDQPRRKANRSEQWL